MSCIGKWSEHVWADPKDSHSPETSDFKNGGSCREGVINPGEREAIFRTKAHSGSSTRTRGGWTTDYLSTNNTSHICVRVVRAVQWCLFYLSSVCLLST